MTTIAVVKTKDAVFFASDDQITCSDTLYITSRSPINRKMVQFGDMIVAVAGEFSVIQKTFDIICEYLKENSFENVFQLRDVIRLGILDSYDYVEQKNDMQSFLTIGNEILVSFKDRVYSISHDGCIIEVDEFYALGSGASYALGYIVGNYHEVSKFFKSSYSDLAKNAVLSACKLDINSSVSEKEDDVFILSYSKNNLDLKDVKK